MNRTKIIIIISLAIAAAGTLGLVTVRTLTADNGPTVLATVEAKPEDVGLYGRGDVPAADNGAVAVLAADGIEESDLDSVDSRNHGLVVVDLATSETTYHDITPTLFDRCADGPVRSCDDRYISTIVTSGPSGFVATFRWRNETDASERTGPLFQRDVVWSPDGDTWTPLEPSDESLPVVSTPEGVFEVGATEMTRLDIFGERLDVPWSGEETPHAAAASESLLVVTVFPDLWIRRNGSWTSRPLAEFPTQDEFSRDIFVTGPTFHVTLTSPKSVSADDPQGSPIVAWTCVDEGPCAAFELAGVIGANIRWREVQTVGNDRVTVAVTVAAEADSYTGPSPQTAGFLVHLGRDGTQVATTWPVNYSSPNERKLMHFDAELNATLLRTDYDFIDNASPFGHRYSAINPSEIVQISTDPIDEILGFPLT